MLNKYDFVYLLKDSQTNEELKYSLRSIEANAGDLINRVVFVGGKPEGFQGYIHIPQEQMFKTKYMNAIMNIYKACKTASITPNFILMNDDFYIMHKVEHIEKYYDGTMQARIDELPDGRYKTQMQDYLKALKHEVNLPLNFAVHTPMLTNKNLAETIIRTLEPESNFRNLYGNLTLNQGGSRSIKDNKLRKQDKTWNKEAIFASSDDDTFKRMLPTLRAKFKVKSRWEM